MLKLLSVLGTTVILFSGIVFSQGNNHQSEKNSQINSIFNNKSDLPRILLDENFDEWDELPNLAFRKVDPLSNRILKAINDNNFLYIFFKIDRILALQENNSLTLFIDTDNNINTGKSIDGIGAEIEFRFGEREGGIFINSQEDTIGVGTLFLILSPTVWSDKFEISLDLNSTFNGIKLFQNPSIRILIKDMSSGYSLPEGSGGAEYIIRDQQLPPLKPYSMKKKSENFIRVLSHNVEFSGFFREDRKESYKRLYQAIQPDIIGFSELYQDYKLDDVTNRLEEILPSPQGKNWKATRTADNVLATRYLFKDQSSAGPFGNGAFLLDLRPTYNSDLFVIIAHPSCCDNDSSRQHEVDAIAAFIRESKATGTPFELQDKTPVMIMGDMNFVGDPAQLKTLLEGDIVHEDIYGKDYTPDWDNTFFDDAKPLSSGLPHTFTHAGNGAPGTHSNGRLDYIIYSGSVLELENSFVMYTPSITQELLIKYKIQKEDSRIASDHLPVVGDFRLTFEQEETSIYRLRQNDKDGIPQHLNSVQTVTGIVTARHEFGEDKIAFIQNDQAGLVLVGGDILTTIETGDLITLTGKVTHRSGLTLLSPDPKGSQLIIHKKGESPKPRVVSIADIFGQDWNSRELIEGQLLKIENVRFLSSGHFQAGSNYNITDERDTLQILIDEHIDLVNKPIPAERFSISGCLIQNKTSPPFDNGYQLYPRSAADLEIIKGIEQVSILTLRQNNSEGIPIYNDSAKTVSGIVTATNQFGRNGPAIIQDDDAGIALYGSAYVSKLKMGDSITVTGPLVIYRGMTEYIYDAEISEIIVHKNVTVPDPQIVTISDILHQEWNGTEALESKLVMIENVIIAESGTFSSYRNYKITDGNRSLDMRLGRAGKLEGVQIPAEQVSVIGIVSQNKSSIPYQGGYQILPRTADDIIIK